MLKFILGVFLGIALVGGGAVWFLLREEPPQAEIPKASDLVPADPADSKPPIMRMGMRKGILTLRFPEPLKAQLASGTIQLPLAQFFFNAQGFTPPYANRVNLVATLEGTSKVILHFDEKDNKLRELQSLGGYIQISLCHRRDGDSNVCSDDDPAVYFDRAMYFRGRAWIDTSKLDFNQPSINMGEIAFHLIRDPQDSCRQNPVLKRRIQLTDAYKRRFPASGFNFFLLLTIGPGAILDPASNLSHRDRFGKPHMVVPVQDLSAPISIDISSVPALKEMPSMALYLAACPKNQSESECQSRIREYSVFQERELFFAQSEEAMAVRLVQDNLHAISCTKDERILFANWFPAIDAARGLFKLSEGMPRGLIDGYAYY